MGSAPVLSVAWAPDGASLASGSVDKTVRIFNLEDGTCQKVLEGHRYRLNAALGKSVIGETGAGYGQVPGQGGRGRRCPPRLACVLLDQNDGSKDNKACTCTHGDYTHQYKANPTCPVQGHRYFLKAVTCITVEVK